LKSPQRIPQLFSYKNNMIDDHKQYQPTHTGRTRNKTYKNTVITKYWTREQEMQNFVCLLVVMIVSSYLHRKFYKTEINSEDIKTCVSLLHLPSWLLTGSQIQTRNLLSNVFTLLYSWSFTPIFSYYYQKFH